MNGVHDRLQRTASEHLMFYFSPQQVDDLIVLERGDGPYVFDTRGSRYIDALSSLFCAQLGHSYGAEMAEAATKAVDQSRLRDELGCRASARYRVRRAADRPSA